MERRATPSTCSRRNASRDRVDGTSSSAYADGLTIQIGSRLGVHEIIGLLGAGGMGEVYRALDTKLNRQVAIKVLPAAYAAEPERVARFHREAQAVAALNHPRIAAIYDFAEADDIKFLVLELVDGETLSDRIHRGPLAIDEAIRIAIQILEALEAAHETGICHRDLKPANLKVTADGGVKILDFGLAKFLDSGSSAPNLTQSPTLSLAGTIPGVILGTAAYMSPEQAKGYAADHRSDLFSFGCVFYEMLTGRPAFPGDSVSEILAGVIKSDVDLAVLPPHVNPRLTELLRRCLEKNPKKRWHAAADVRVELEGVAARPTEIPHAASTGVQQPLWRRAIPWLGGAIAGAVLAVFAMRTLNPPPPAPSAARFEIEVPEGQTFTNTGRHMLAISPDGSKVVYVANRRLYMRDINAIAAQPIQGSEAGGAGVTNPVFSPDGRSIAFWAASDSSLKRISVTGGSPGTLTKTPNPFGLSWDVDDRLVYTALGTDIMEVPATGGEAKALIRIDKDRTAANPQFLPDGRTLLYSVKGVDQQWTTGAVVAQRIGAAPKILLEGGTDARYLPTGHLVFTTSGVLKAMRFDPASLEVQGDAVIVVDGVRRVALEQVSSSGVAHAAFSSSGVMAFVPGPSDPENTGDIDLALYDGKGGITPLKLPLARYGSPRVSPDGKSVAYDLDDGKEANIWLYHLSGDSAARRLTFGGNNRFPTWSHDGQWVLFQSTREGDSAIFKQRADGAGQAQRLTRSEKGESHIPQSSSPDGQHVVFTISAGSSRLADLNLVDGKSSTISGTESTDAYCEGALSPDGRWLTFHTRPTSGGLRQVFLQPFPATGARYLVLAGTAGHPYWTRDGKNLNVNVSPVENRIVAVTTAPVVQFGEPQAFSRAGRMELNPSVTRRAVDALPDGRVIGLASQTAPAEIDRFVVVVNWFDELRRLVPAR